MNIPPVSIAPAKAAPAWTIAAEVQRLRDTRVGSVGNSVASLFASSALGSAGGPGFGWRDVTAIKLGVTHDIGKDLMLRAGVSHVRQPVPAGETFFIVLAPGVVQDHLTVGATWRLPGGGGLSGFFLHVPAKSVSGVSSIRPGPRARAASAVAMRACA